MMRVQNLRQIRLLLKQVRKEKKLNARALGEVIRHEVHIVERKD